MMCKWCGVRWCMRALDENAFQYFVIFQLFQWYYNQGAEVHGAQPIV